MGFWPLDHQGGPYCSFFKEPPDTLHSVSTILHSHQQGIRPPAYVKVTPASSEGLSTAEGFVQTSGQEVGDRDLCPEPLGSSAFPSVDLGLLARPEPSYLWGRLPVGRRTGRRGRRWGLSPARYPTQDGAGHTAAIAISPAILLASFPCSPISLFSGGSGTVPPSPVWPGVQGPGTLSKVGFPAPNCLPDNTATHRPPDQEKAAQRLSLLIRNFPSQAQDTLDTSPPSRGSRIKGRSWTASKGLWGKLRGPQGKNLSLTSHPATFSLLLTHTHTHTELLLSRQCF